jgi:hypothetical protein
VRPATAAAGEVGTAAAATATVGFAGTGDQRRSSDRCRGEYPDPKTRLSYCDHGFLSVAGRRFTQAHLRGNLRNRLDAVLPSAFKILSRLYSLKRCSS